MHDQSARLPEGWRPPRVPRVVWRHLIVRFVVFNRDDIVRRPHFVRLKLCPRRLHGELAVPDLAHTATGWSRRSPVHTVRPTPRFSPGSGHAIQHVRPVAWSHRAQFTGVAEVSDATVATALEAAQRCGLAQRAIGHGDRRQTCRKPIKANAESLRAEARYLHRVDELPIAHEAHHRLNAASAWQSNRVPTH